MDSPSSKGRSPDDPIDVLKTAIQELEKVIDENPETESNSDSQESPIARADSTPNSGLTSQESGPVADETHPSLDDLESDDLGDDDFLSPVRGARQLPRHRDEQPDPFEQLGNAVKEEAVARGPGVHQPRATQRPRSDSPLRMDRTEVRRAKLSSLSSAAPSSRGQQAVDTGPGERLKFEEKRSRPETTAIQPEEFAKVGLVARVLVAGVFFALIVGLIKLSFTSRHQDEITDVAQEQERGALIDHVEQANATMIQFWTAPDLDSKLEVTWDAERVGPIMRTYYENYRLPSRRNLADYSVISDRQRHIHSQLPPEYILGSVEDAIGRITDVILRPTGDRVLLDWEATFGYNTASLEELMQTKSETPITMRVVIVPADYYNFQFRDEELYQSFAMTVADPAEPRCYAFAERKSEVGVQLMKLLFADREPRSVAVTLKLRFPIGNGALCAEIVDLVNLHWAVAFGEGESPSAKEIEDRR